MITKNLNSEWDLVTAMNYVGEDYTRMLLREHDSSDDTDMSLELYYLDCTGCLFVFDTNDCTWNYVTNGMDYKSFDRNPIYMDYIWEYCYGGVPECSGIFYAIDTISHENYDYERGEMESCQ